MRIAICDDEKYFRDVLKEQLNKYTNEYGVDFVYSEFSSGELLLESNIDFDLIFIDYQMHSINGIDTIDFLRKRNDKTIVIFISSYPNIVFDSLKVDTHRFLVKPLKYNDLCEAINSFFKKYNSNAYILVFDEENDKMRKINETDIIYVMADNIYCKIMTIDRIYLHKETLSKFQKKLKSDFFYRSHRSYLVNFHYIDNYSDSKIFFENEEQAQLTKVKHNDFQKKYMAFLKRRLTGV